jgi:hypothetical protein
MKPGDRVVSGYFRNKLDPRYEFVVVETSLGWCIEQMGDPPENPFILIRVIWGQWKTASTTKNRLEALKDKLINANPKTKWFKTKVNWIYEI